MESFENITRKSLLEMQRKREPTTLSIQKTTVQFIKESPWLDFSTAKELPPPAEMLTIESLENICNSTASELETKYKRFVTEVYLKRGKIFYTAIDSDTYQLDVKWFK